MLMAPLADVLRNYAFEEARLVSADAVYLACVNHVELNG